MNATRHRGHQFGLIAAMLGIVLFGGTLQSFAGDAIIWVRSSFPPVEILKGPDEGTGIVDQWRKLYETHLRADYDIRNKVMNFARRNKSFEDTSKTHCSTTVMPRSLPEGLAHLSIIQDVAPPLGIITSTDKQHLFGDPSAPLSLEALLQNEDLKLVVVKDHPYAGLDAILAQYADAPHLTMLSPGSLTAQTLKMVLEKKRMDYTIDWPFFPAYVVGKDNDVFYRITEAPDFIPVHVGCTKNEVGRRVIQQVNTIIRKYRHTTIREVHEVWLPQSLVPAWLKAREAAYQSPHQGTVK